jgi:putative ATPase
MTLFDERQRPIPLAARMRPRHREEFVGQQHVLAPGTPLSNLLGGDDRGTVSVILYGPPGTGKTTLASLISESSGRRLAELSAVTAGVRDVRAVIDEAKQRREFQDQGTVLFIDEVHRFSKSQQDALLPAVEHGWVTLVAATTENPMFSVISPLLSRSLIVPLRPLSDDDVAQLITRAVADPRGLDGSIVLTDEARDALVRLSGGDARRALTALEAAASAEVDTVTMTEVERAVASALVRYDRDGDQHYDVISAFIKSVRGSDPDAALHYLARMLEAGEDPRFIARRLMILASEDVGMADPSVLQTATAAATSVAMVGMPEARIILAHATIHASLAPKSNAVEAAIDAALADVRAGLIGQVPSYLRDHPVETGEPYIYPHGLPGGISQQPYLPDGMRDRIYYRPTSHGSERSWAEVRERLRDARRSDPSER